MFNFKVYYFNLKIFLSFIFFLFGLQNALAQFLLKGRITDQAGTSIANANITNKVISIVSDSTGNFEMPSDSVSAVLTFTYAGYQPYRALVTSGSFAVIRLNPDPLLLDLVLVTAFDQNTTVQRAPAAVSVLHRAQLERFGNVSLVPVVNTVPGVKMDERSPGSYRLNIRGNLLRSTFGVRNVKIYWNGIPFTDANGSTYLQQVSLNQVDRMDIVKGPSGSMYGAGTGGVVLLTSSPGQLDEKYFKLQSILGSYGLSSIHGAFKTRNERTGSSLSFSHQQSNGYRDHTNLRRDVANYSSSFQVSNKQELNVSAFYSDLYYQTPGGLTAAEQKADPRQSRPSSGLSKSAAEQKAALYIKTLFAGMSHSYDFNQYLRNNTSFVVNHTRFRNPSIRNYERKTEQGASLRSLVRYAKGKFSSTLGGEYQYSFNNTATYGNRRGLADTLQYHDEIASRQFNGFIQAAVAMGNFNITAGISYNNFHYSLLRISNAGSREESSNFEPQYVPRLSLGHTVSDKINWYASVSKGYSPPSVDEVHASDGRFNRELRAEFAWNYETGIKSQPIPGKLHGEIVVYHFNLRNTIVSRRDASGGDFYVNAGKTKQTGVEVAANYLIVSDAEKTISRLNLWGSATSVRALFDDYQQGVNTFDGNKLTGTAPNVFVLGIDLNAWKFFGNLSYTYTGRIPLNDANTFYARRYNMYTAKLGYKSNQKGRIAPAFFLSYEGIANEPYSLGNDLNAAGNRYYNPSAPQTFTFGATFRFNVGKQANK